MKRNLILCFIFIYTISLSASEGFRALQDKSKVIDLVASTVREAKELLEKAKLLPDAKDISIDEVPLLEGLNKQLEVILKTLSPSAYYGGVEIIWDDPQSRHRVAIGFSPYTKTLGDKIEDVVRTRTGTMPTTTNFPMKIDPKNVALNKARLIQMDEERNERPTENVNE